MPKAFSFRAVLLASIASLALPAAAHAEAVGTAGAANKTSTGTAPGAGTRVIEIGAQVLRNEKIDTSPSGSVQLLFIDKTALTIGPNSSIVIDEFVYNPVDSTGKLAISMGKGVLRIVGGQATHTGGAVVTTPAAAVGIRGGIATIKHTDAQGTRAINNFGSMTLSSGGVLQPVRMGFVAATSGAGVIPTPPTRVTNGEVAVDTAATTSRQGQNGGTSRAPSDTSAANAGLGVANAPLDITAPPKNGPGAPSRTIAASNGRSNEASTLINQASQVSSITSLKDNEAVPVPLPGAAFLLTTTAGAGSKVPFLTASFATAGAVSVSPVLGYRAAGGTTVAPNVARIFQASLGVDGAGASQKSFLSVMTGEVIKTSQSYVQIGGFRATAPSPNSPGVRSSLIVSSSGGASSTTNPAAGIVPISVDANGLPTGSYNVSQNTLSVVNSAGFVQSSKSNGFDSSPFPAASNNYQFDQTFTRSTASVALGADRPTLTLNGYVGAIGQTGTLTPPNATSGSRGSAYIVTNLSGAPGDVAISLDSTTSRLNAQFNVAGNGASNTLANANFRFGSTGASGVDGNRGTYVDLNNFAARSERTFVLQNGAVTGTETSSINGQVLNSTANGGDSTGLIMVNANSVNPAALFPGVPFCNCSYTQWGFWSYNTFRSNSTNGFVDNSGIATWVAGIPSSPADIQNAVAANVQATYTGHAIATISNNGAQYLAASPFVAAVNFGARSAAIGIPSLDGYAYGTQATNITPTAAGNFVTVLPGFALNGTSAPTSMALTSSFFQSKTDKLGEVGGNLRITKPTDANYLGAGIFAGAKQ